MQRAQAKQPTEWIDMSEHSRSFGFKYYPEAFDDVSYVVGQRLVACDEFRELFLQYVEELQSDWKQLVHFRPRFVQELSRLKAEDVVESHDTVKDLWCALSLSTDRFFAEQSRAYDWSVADEIEIRSRWYEMISSAFLAHCVRKRIEKNEVESWTADFVTLTSGNVENN